MIDYNFTIKWKYFPNDNNPYCSCSCSFYSYENECRINCNNKNSPLKCEEGIYKLIKFTYER